jgi:hypothetical protein
MKLSGFLLLFLGIHLFYDLLSMMFCLLRRNFAGRFIVGTVCASFVMLAMRLVIIYSLIVVLVEKFGGLLWSIVK